LDSTPFELQFANAEFRREGLRPVPGARKPSNLSFEEAASVPVASQTALEGIFTHGHLEKGQTILIHGGAGAVGAYAVQLASHAGATVIATASGDDEAYLNSIGASRVIDYREAQFEKVLREKVDVVFDLIGGCSSPNRRAPLHAGCSASHEMHYEKDDARNQGNVDERGGNVKCKKSQQPKHNQNCGNCPKHVSAPCFRFRELFRFRTLKCAVPPGGWKRSTETLL
jgi:hypothetical protein